MKFIVLVLSVILFSFLSSKPPTHSISNEWVQYLGEDSVKYVYHFKDTLGCKILQRIVVEEVNKGNGGKKLFSNQLLFDSSGKIKRVGVTRSVSITENEYEKGKSAMNYSYDQDIILFKNDSLLSFKSSNSSNQIISVFRIDNFLYTNDGELYRPIYNYLDLSRNIEFKYIGKGVDPKLNDSNFKLQTIKGIYKKYKHPSVIKKNKKKNSGVNSIEVKG